jgi:phage shock protein B
MYALMTLAVILFFTVLGPLIVIFYFITKWKQTREISSDDEHMLEDLWSLSQRLEDRIETLERILDDDTSTHGRQ